MNVFLHILCLFLGYACSPTCIQNNGILLYFCVQVSRYSCRNFSGTPYSVLICVPSCTYRYIFWSEWLKNNQQTPRIGRASGDGSSLTYIRSTELGWPNGLTIDLQEQRIWWCDAYFNRYHRAYLFLKLQLV